MLVFPAIDLVGGKCVRLTKGDFASTKIYHDDPVQMLQGLAIKGANFVHVVDLDGAKKGGIVQLELIHKLAQNIDLDIQVGGGIRTIADINHLLNAGVKRVVLGSVCVVDRNLVKEMLTEFGCEKIVLALDCLLNENGVPVVKTHGWQNSSGESLWELLGFYHEAKYLLCTDIKVDGTLMGPNLELYREIKRCYPKLQIIASGGVSSDYDLDELRKLDVYAVVVGKAMYEGTIDIAKALKC